MNAQGFRFNVEAHRSVRVKNGYTIDVRTSAWEKVCYFDTHQSMYVVENNCKDNVAVYLYYFKSSTDYWSPRLKTYTSSYYGPKYTIKPGETLQIYGPSYCVCSIMLKSIVDTKFKTIRARKLSELHSSFHCMRDGILTYYGVATDPSARSKPHRDCARKYNFLPVDHSSLSDLPARLMAARTNQAWGDSIPLNSSSIDSVFFFSLSFSFFSIFLFVKRAGLAPTEHWLSPSNKFICKKVTN